MFNGFTEGTTVLIGADHPLYKPVMIRENSNEDEHVLITARMESQIVSKLLKTQVVLPFVNVSAAE